MANARSWVTGPESSIMNALRYRDRAVMAEVIMANHGFLLALITPLVGKRVAEDVALDTWMKTLAALDRFQKIASLRTWLARLALTTARSKPHLASRDGKWGTDPASPIKERFDEGGKWSKPPTEWDHNAPVDLLSEAMLRYCIEKHLGHLPPDQQTVLRLRELECMDPKEIATATQLTESNVRLLLHRGRQRLHMMMEDFQRGGHAELPGDV